VTLRNTEANSY